MSEWAYGGLTEARSLSKPRFQLRPRSSLSFGVTGVVNARSRCTTASCGHKHGRQVQSSRLPAQIAKAEEDRRKRQLALTLDFFSADSGPG